jgi:hypothetical protein
MRISHRHRFVFFANPRTGSESLREFLDPLSDVRGPMVPTAAEPFFDHMRPADARGEFVRRGWDFEGYYRFVLVRNPWRRLASLYAMVRSRADGRIAPFGAWLKATRPDGIGGGGRPEEHFQKYGTYSLQAFAGDGEGRLLVDDVFRIEDAASLPDELRNRGLPIPAGATIPHFNFTRGSVDYRQLYADELIELVRERYADEIERFGYQFPSGRFDSPAGEVRRVRR